jgi:hypothetical protein
MKAPCDEDPEINVPTPQCIKGSPWVQERAFYTLVGSLVDPTITVIDNNNFHPADEVFPYHHPQISNSCDGSSGACEVDHISNTQNAYAKLDEQSLSKTAIAATDVKMKMKSAQSIHQAARETDASYDTLDQQWDECAKINQEVYDWALSMASTSALNNLEAYGQKLVMGQDQEAINGGTWIIQDLKFKEV